MLTGTAGPKARRPSARRKICVWIQKVHSSLLPASGSSGTQYPDLPGVMPQADGKPALHPFLLSRQSAIRD